MVHRPTWQKIARTPMTESTKYGLKTKIFRQLFHSINIFAYYHTTWQNVASTIKNWNPQAKGKFQVFPVLKQELQKSRQVLYSHKKLYPSYIDRNISMNSYETCFIRAVSIWWQNVGSAINNRHLKRKENFKLSDIKYKIYKKNG